MRNLDELKAIAIKAQDGFEKREKDIRGKLDEAAKKAVSASAVADEAVANENYEAYSKAKAEESFYRAQENEYKMRVAEAYFSVQEYNAIIRETDAAAAAANAPLYDRLREIAKEWKGIVAALNNNHAKAYAIDIALTNSRPMKERTGAASAKWHIPAARTGIPAVIKDLFATGSDIARELRL